MRNLPALHLSACTALRTRLNPSQRKARVYTKSKNKGGTLSEGLAEQ